MAARRYVPPPEVLPLIRQYREARKAGRRPHPRAKEIYMKLGISESTFFKLARRAAS